MKPQYFAVLAGALLLAVIVLVAAGRPQTGTTNGAAVQPPDRLVTVIGESELRVKPDQALVTLNVWTHGASATEAEALNLASVQRIQTALANSGVPDADVDVARASLDPNTYQDFTGSPSVSGFEARSSLRILVRNIKRVQQVVDAGLAAGATGLEQIVYRQENPEQSKQTVTHQALDNARTRATNLLKSEGETLGDLRNIEVLSEEVPAQPENITGQAGPAQGENWSSAASLVFRIKVRATFTY